MPTDDELLPTEEDLNFEKDTLYKLYQTGGSREISPERWDRVRRDIRFEDVVADLTGHSGSTSIRCPFHGSDSRPSFWLYKGTNDGWCFGCPNREQYYDHVRFVAKYLDIKKPAALRWLEKKWDLPPILDVIEEEEDGGPPIKLSFADLQEPYMLKAIKQVQEFKDVELAEDYLCYYFKSMQLMKFAEDAKKQGEGEDALELEAKAATTLAGVLGKEEVGRIFTRKQIGR